jgi:hypothetical protein
MKVRLVSAGALALAAAIGAGRAGEDTGDSAALALGKIARLGPGVHAVRKDKKRRVTSCVIVGQARVSTALGRAKGLELARARARLAALAEFRRWLREEVRVYETVEDESVTLVEAERAGEDGPTEAGKAVEKASRRFESIAGGLVRGARVLHAEVDGPGSTYTLVLGWDAATSRAAQKAEGDLKGATNRGRKVGSRKETADAAREFFGTPAGGTRP